MPFLPLPEETTLGTELPVSTADDVLAEFANPHKTPETAPVRDAIVAALAEGFLEYQDASDRAAGQSDPLRATGSYLRAYAEEHDVVPTIGESESSLRSRLFASPAIVTPGAIERAINEIISPAECFISELDLDGWFIHGSAPSVWESYVGADPDYPDRYYDDVPSGLPGGCIPSDSLPRSFHVRVPALQAQDEAIQYIGDTFFVFDSDSTIDSYSTHNTWYALGAGAAYPNAAAQSFTGNGGVLTSARFLLKKIGAPTGSAVAKIYAHSGTYGTNSVPTGAPLATSALLNVSTLNTGYVLTDFEFSGIEKITLVDGTNYVVAVEYTGGDPTNYVGPATDDTTASHSGNASLRILTTWGAGAAEDMVFAVRTENDDNYLYIFQNQQTSVDLFNAVIARVESIKGQGIAWSLIIDPRL